MSITPTLLIYGTPTDPHFFSDFVEKEQWGIALDNGRARDPIFTIYENLARADALMCFPNAHPVHLVTIMAEAEVGHPLIVTESTPNNPHFRTKPIVFFGEREAWAPFLESFSEMQRQGLIRDSFSRLAFYTSSSKEAREYIVANLPAQIPSTRLHYYVHAKRDADLESRLREDVRPPSGTTVAFFGSASTTNEEHLKRAEAVARTLVRRDFNILHGGGVRGVMGQLTAAGNRLKGFVKGVTVHATGAPKIFFERAAGDRVPEEVDLHIASKDMLHRIESYAGNSEAFVALDGGIGSVQEILVIADLRAQQHPVVTFETVDNRHVLKPLWLLNESKIYSPLLNYLKERKLSRLINEIQVADSISALEEGLLAFFTENKPVPIPFDRASKFRTKYKEIRHPTVAVQIGEEEPPPKPEQQK
jgi:predicted Rossmann-fold nucleotide-binding protein